MMPTFLKLVGSSSPVALPNFTGKKANPPNRCQSGGAHAVPNPLPTPGPRGGMWQSRGCQLAPLRSRLPSLQTTDDHSRSSSSSKRKFRELCGQVTAMSVSITVVSALRPETTDSTKKKHGISSRLRKSANDACGVRVRVLDIYWRVTR